MPHITYAYLGPDERAARLAKKGTASDITLYNAKKGDAHLNLVTPTRFPEKILSLLYALDLADELILAPDRIDRALGETVVAADLLGRTRGFVRADGAATLPELQTLLAKTRLKDLSFSAEPEGVFREQLYDRATRRAAGPLVVPVDHAFPVKGVGTVALALVRSGVLRRHTSLQAYPSAKLVEVRSVQIHDVDHDEAPAGTRVGLALKGAEPEDVGRGRILAPPGNLPTVAAGAATTAEVELSPFSKWSPRAGAVLHLFHALQDVTVRVRDVEGTRPRLRLGIVPESAFARVASEPAVLADIDNQQQRLVGRVAF